MTVHRLTLYDTYLNLLRHEISATMFELDKNAINEIVEYVANDQHFRESIGRVCYEAFEDAADELGILLEEEEE